MGADVVLVGGTRFAAELAYELGRHAVSSMRVLDVADVSSSGARVVVVDIDSLSEPPLDLLRRLRLHSDAGLVAVCTGEERVPELLAVADDALGHPDRVRELVARLRALLRRSPRGEATGDPTLTVGDVLLDRGTHRVEVSGEAVRLPLKQFRMLELLLLNAGQVLPRATVLTRVWGAESLAGSNTLEVQMKRLRAALGPAARITTVRGVGYRFERPVDRG